jgi:hypothetical protein
MWSLLLGMLSDRALADPALADPPDPPAVEEGEPTPPPDPLIGPFPVAFEFAKGTYLAGDTETAHDLFLLLQRRLLLGENVETELAAESLIFLGEIQYSLGEYDGAAATFRSLLLREPSRSINPYHHPTEVVGVFELVRQAVREELARIPPFVPLPPPPAPMWTWSPLGLPQFFQGKPIRGTVYAGLQGTCGLVSLGMLAHLRSENGTLKDPTQWTDDEFAAKYQQIQMQRWAIQWPATFAFYGVWAFSLGDARRTWAREHREESR